MDNGRRTEPTHQELVEHLEGVVMTATAKGGNGTEAALVTWYRQPGTHRSRRWWNKQSGENGMVITESPVKISGLDACAVRVEGKLVHLSHKDVVWQVSVWNGSISK